jgi:hypothetical protein
VYQSCDSHNVIRTQTHGLLQLVYGSFVSTDHAQCQRKRVTHKKIVRVLACIWLQRRDGQARLAAMDVSLGNVQYVLWRCLFVSMCVRILVLVAFFIRQTDAVSGSACVTLLVLLGCVQA